MYAIGDLQFTETGTSVGRKPRAKISTKAHASSPQSRKHIFSGYDIEQVLKRNISTEKFEETGSTNYKSFSF